MILYWFWLPFGLPFGPNFHLKSMKNRIQEPILTKNGFWHPFLQVFIDVWAPWGTLKTHQNRKKRSKSCEAVWTLPTQRLLYDFSLFFCASGRPMCHLGTILAPFWEYFQLIWYNFGMICVGSFLVVFSICYIQSMVSTKFGHHFGLCAIWFWFGLW